VDTGLAALPFGYVVLVAFWTVLAAELVGDKSIYTVASLSVRFRARVVLASITAAFACKMLAAVMLGRMILRIHSEWTGVLSALAFFVSALFIWFKEPERVPRDRGRAADWWRAALVCFASICFTEWGDPGQIAVAALTVKSHWPVATWLGGTLAMMTKTALAMTLGIKLRDRMPQRVLRPLASGSCCALGILALLKLA